MMTATIDQCHEKFAQQERVTTWSSVDCKNIHTVIWCASIININQVIAGSHQIYIVDIGATLPVEVDGITRCVDRFKMVQSDGIFARTTQDICVNQWCIGIYINAIVITAASDDDLIRDDCAFQSDTAACCIGVPRSAISRDGVPIRVHGRVNQLNAEHGGRCRADDCA